MSSQPATIVPFTIDNALPGMLAHPDSPDLYRIRIQPEHTALGEPTIKYLAAPNTSKTITGPDAYFRRRNNLAFDKVPTGDWIVGQLTTITEKGDNEGKLQLASTSSPDDTTNALNALGLASAEPVWCDTTVDIRDCHNTPSTNNPLWTTLTTPTGNEVHLPNPNPPQCMDYVSAATIPIPPGIITSTYPAQEEEEGKEKEAILISDWLPGRHAGLQHTILAHQTIHSLDPDLTPRFLAHVTENGPGSRVIGFLLERIPDAREAGPADLGKCQAVVARLHALGVVKGKLSRHSFLVRPGDGEVIIQGPFKGSIEDGADKEEVMRAEMASLERVLRRTPSVFEDQAARIRRLVDPERMGKLEEFEKACGFVVPFVYWQESEEGGGRITLTAEQHVVLAKEFEANGFRWSRELQEKAVQRFGLAAEGN